MWNPKTIDMDKPLYIAIVDALERDINSGVLKPGQQMPPHRELADIIGVNVSTITRAYKEAERRGLVSGTVGRGTFISVDVNTATSMMRPETNNIGKLEMGLVLPLYEVEPDIEDKILHLVQSGHIAEYLRYTDPLGLPEHREIGALWTNRFGVPASADDIVVCSGAQHSMACCLASLFQAGDKIAVDSLTYPGIKSLSAMLGIRLVPVDMDGEGMIPEALEMVCRRDRIRGLYIMPGVQNPTTVSMSEGRRGKIAEVVLRHGLILIEDDAYSYTRPALPVPVACLVPQNSVYIAGVSKAFYAGLRVAFVVAPKHLRNRIAKAVLNTIWMTPALNAAIVSECIKDGTADKIMVAKKEEAARRFAVVRDKLAGYAFAGPAEGFFIWLNIPDRWSGKEFELMARESGVNIFCAEKFAVGSTTAPHAVRISLTGPSNIGELSRGIDVIKSLLDGEFVELDPML
ncbi:MAG: PLP-dependent aminotransferase family protein [Caulobacteraceae bacterium]